MSIKENSRVLVETVVVIGPFDISLGSVCILFTLFVVFLHLW